MCVAAGFFVSVGAAAAILCCVANGFFVSARAAAAILWAFIAAVFGSVCG